MSALWLVVTSTALSALLPAYVLMAVPSTADPVWVFSAILTTYSGLRLSWYISLGQARVLEFAFFLYVYLFLGLAPLSQLRAGSQLDTTPGVVPTFNVKAALIVFVGVAGWEFGHWAASRRSQRTLSENHRDIIRGRVVALGVVGVSAGSLYIGAVGLPALLGSRQELAAAQTSAFGTSALAPVLIALAFIPSLVVIHCLVLQRREARAQGRPRTGLVLLLASLCLTAIIVNPISSPRYVYGTVAMSLAVLAGGLATRQRVGVTFSAVTIVAVLGFSYLSPFRYIGSEASVRAVGPVDVWQSSGDYDSFAQINNAVNFTEARGIPVGKQALGVLGFWFPRSLWEDKPQDTGVLLATHRGYSFRNLSAPLWAEFYVNGGIALVAIGFVATGFATARASLAGLAALRRGGIAAAGTAIVGFYTIIILRGSLLQATGYAVCIAASLAFVSRRKLAA